MAKGDQLDIILCDPNLTWDDWETLGSIFELTNINQASKQEKREILNREIRHAYGNSALNLFRNNYEPDYEEIVRKTAAVLNLTEKAPLKAATVAQIEEFIVLEVLSRLKAQIIKESGIHAWHAIEDSVDFEIQKYLIAGKCPSCIVSRFKALRGSALLTALLAGRMAGLPQYVAASELILVLARRFGFPDLPPMAGSLLERAIAALFGPLGWTASFFWLGLDMGDTNWKRVIPAVFVIAALRKRLRHHLNPAIFQEHYQAPE
ncbi:MULTISPECIES: YaaW family protein [Sporomusaceae]|uniref:YaaW family protein n=1 Tax=Sporomusaceae TaxID=1843490 RepID=UPI00036751DE|nr:MULTISPECIES: YaaW family protein [Sporomusaceae]